MHSLCLQYILHWWISNKWAIASPVTGIKQNGTLLGNAISKQQLYAYFDYECNWQAIPAAWPILLFPTGNQCLITFSMASLLLRSFHLLWNHDSPFPFLPQAFFVIEFFQLLIPCSQSVYLLKARPHNGGLLCRLFLFSILPSQRWQKISLHLIWGHLTALRTVTCDKIYHPVFTPHLGNLQWPRQ